MFNQNYERQDDFNANFNGYNDVNMDVDINVENMTPAAMDNMQMPTNVSTPIIEPMQERVIQRTIMHEVPHVCPIRTKIINNHVYRHTYRPSYSCCSEDTVTNIQCGSCCQYR